MILKKIQIASLLLCLAFVGIAQVNVKIDINQNRHTISPYIYGMNGSVDSTFAAMRVGGNRYTGYNWENNCSNSGSDNQNVSDSYLVQSIASQDQSISGIIIRDMVTKAKKNRQFTSVTLPMAGFVAADANGMVTAAERAPSARWVRVVNEKKTAFDLDPNTCDTTVYVDEEINYFTKTLGSSREGGIMAYYLDNEPDYWYKNHPRICGVLPTIANYMPRALLLAKTIKRMDTSALVIGPAIANLEGLRRFAIGYNSGYGSFMACFLDKMRQESVAQNRRLLDVFDFHWYPEKIVSYSFDGNDPIDDASVANRLQAPRALWDTTYSDPTYSTLNLLGYMKMNVKKYYPGTKIAFTEYLYGAENHFSGGLALADVLGVFGREDVYLATKWYINDKTMMYNYGKSAFDLYRNYDGKYGRFGDVSVSDSIVLETDRARVSSVASLDAQGKLHVILINKTNKQDSVLISFANGQYRNAQVWGFNSTISNIMLLDSLKSLQGKKEVFVKLPKYSASHFIFEPEAQPYILSAVTSADSSAILLKISSKLTKNYIFDVSKLSVFDGGVEFPVVGVRYSVDSSLVVVSLSAKYTGKSVLHVESTEGLWFEGVLRSMATSIMVENKLVSAQSRIVSAATSSSGYAIVAILTKAMLNNEANKSAFTITSNSKTVSYESSSITDNTITFIFTDRFSSEDIVSISGVSVAAVDGSKSNISEFEVENNASSASPVINSTSIENAGYTVNITFDQWLMTTKSALSGLKLTINGKSVGAFSLQYNVVSVDLKDRVRYGDVITFDYDTVGKLQSYSSFGMVNPVVSYSITNTVKKPEYVALPAKIEAETFLYASSGILNNGSLDKADLKKTRDMYGIVPGKRIGFAVNSLKATDYTCLYRYATISSGSFQFMIDDVVVDTVEFGGSSAAWFTLGQRVTIPAGNHEVALVPLSGMLSLNWLEFKAIDTVSVVGINVITSINRVNIYFDLTLQTLPQASSFQFFDENGTALKIDEIKFLSNKNSVSFTLEDISSVNKVFMSIIPDGLKFDGNVKLSNMDRRQIYTTRINELNNWFNVYSNGSALYFKASDDSFLSKLDVKITSILGQTVFNRSDVSGREPLSLQLPKGIYIAQVKIGDDEVSQKVVIE